MYLVEDHGSIENLSLPESTLLQAVTNTQVTCQLRARLGGRGVTCGLWFQPEPPVPAWVPVPRSLMASL